MWNFPGFDHEEKIAESRISIVFRAVRREDGRGVVLKTLHKEYPTPREIGALKMEHEIARRFDHPGVVKGLDLQPYRNAFVYVMEDFGARALSLDLQEGPLAVPLFLHYAIKIAEGLGHIHDRGVFHKDMKPANLVHERGTGRIAIIDFSIASLISREKQRGAGTGVREGSLPYTSPEQTGRMNRPVDHRTDFYSLGVTFYQMLTGRLPFVTQDPMELVHCHLARSPEPVHEVNRAVPEAISRIVARLMEKTAEERYQSAYGLVADLYECRASLERGGAVAVFELGKSDRLSSFQIPHKLYGREPEIETMLGVFAEVCEGGTEMVLVSGYSGVGKSALIEEIHKPIVERKGYFISSKFDQYRRDIPYLSIRDALGGLVRQILAEPDGKVAVWRAELLGVLDGMGQVIVDVIPEVELLLGAQPAVIALEGQEAQSRFVAVFDRFLGVFAAKEHPLVFFVDDLQWADLASLRLFEAILDRKDTHHLLILGAYRDNEVNAGHPLMLTLDKIQKKRPVREIRLSPLDLPHTTALVADTLHTRASAVSPLAELVHKKTHGNPFFLVQLLMSLHDQGLIRYSFEEQRWTWDLGQIHLAGVTDQVVELMSARIRELDAAVQDLLKLAACLGNAFDFRTLSTISGLAPRRVLSLLLPAVEAGLVLSLDESFKYFVGAEVELLSSADNFNFKFLHDRVHEAAYALMSEGQRKEVHLRIGRDLRRSLDAAGQNERLFDVVNHLNLGIDLVVDEGDREDLAALNLSAGKKARQATAHFAARDYLRRGLDLMGEGAWARRYQTMFELHRNLVECEYLCGDMKRAEELFDVTVAHTEDRRDQANIYELMMGAYMKFGRFAEGVRLGRRALRLFGVELPEDPATFQRACDEEFEAIDRLIGARTIAELEPIPLSEDRDLEITTSLLHQTWDNSYFAAGMYVHGTLAALRILTLSLTRGYTRYTPFGYVIYALNINSEREDYDKGYEYGALSVRLQQKANNIYMVAKVNNLFAHFMNPYKRDMKHCVTHYEEAYHACLQTGDLWYGLWAVCFIPKVRFIRGDPLDELWRETQKYHDYAEGSGNQMMFALLNFDEHMILNLQGKTEDRASFNSDRYSEEAMVALLEGIPFDFGLFWYDSYKSFVAYLYGDLDRALEHSARAEKNKNTAPGIMLVVEHHYYRSLIGCATMDRLAPEERAQRRAQIDESVARLTKWAAHAPMNHEPKLLIIQGEVARIEGRTLDALSLYERAADSAAASGALHNAAVANELAGKLLLGAGRARAARGYLGEAVYFYERWGAARKVKDLEDRYRNLLPRARHDALVETAGSTTSSGGELLDLATVLKASQALSGEIVLSDLLKRMLGILIENAGAQKGALLIERDGEWVIAAEGSAAGGVEVPAPRPFGASADVCAPIVQYVLKSRESVVVEDARAEARFPADEYVARNGVRSVLCLPITQKGRLSAVLYLENNLVTGAFTTDRLSVLGMLSSQVAISIENALLYANLEEVNRSLEAKVSERTHELRGKNRELEAKNQELVQKHAEIAAAGEEIRKNHEHLLRTQGQLVMQEKMAFLGTMTAGVAHELKNPLNFIINFAGDVDEVMKDIVAEHGARLALMTAPAPVSSGVTDSVLDLLEDVSRSVERISFHGRRATDVISMMMGLSQGRTTQKEPVSLNDMLGRYVDLTYQGAPRSDVELSIEKALDPAVGQVTLSATGIGRVVASLLTNSIESVLLKRRRAGAGYEPRILVTTRSDGDRVEIRFWDNGVGIPAGMMKQIFHPFFTTKAETKNIGLGLPIAYDVVVQEHGGELVARSEEGEFAEMVVRLPLG